MTASGGIEVSYVAEPVGSITRARNRAIDEARGSGAEALVFIDDDEIVAPDWLEQLWAAHLEGTGDVVFGHVETLYPTEVPDAIRRSGVADNPVHPNGSLHLTCASNNTLIPTSVLSDIRFDPFFDVSSGEDTDFFRRLNSSGVAIRFAAGPKVFEPWSMDRANSAFLRARARRGGWLDARIRLNHDGRVAALKLSASILKNLIEAVRWSTEATVRRDRAFSERAAERWNRAAGKIAGLAGRQQPPKSDWQEK